MISSAPNHPWGEPPWQIDFAPPPQPVPAEADFAVIGGGFTGLAAAAWLRLLAPEKSVVVFEAGRIGAGASGRTGGIVLAETAAGDLPGLGDVLGGFTRITERLGGNCDLSLNGAWEIGRSGGLAHSPISWEDSGTLRVVNEVPGGTLDPGKLVSKLARAACGLGATVLENCALKRIDWRESPVLTISGPFNPSGCEIAARKILFATNALSLGLSGLREGGHPRLTLAAASAPLSRGQLEAIGLTSRKPFYTVDLPYLWGRVRPDNSIVWGAGLVSSPDSDDLEGVQITAQEPSQLFASLERRVRELHPALASAEFTHRWGGPILFMEDWRPVFRWHSETGMSARNAIVLGAYAGHGVALSVYLATWAAETLLERRDLPAWT